MGDLCATDDASVTTDHERAAEAFVSRATARFEDTLEEVVVFGSVARGESDDLSSDVDVLVVIADDADSTALLDDIREIAYDVMLEYGPVVELHAVSQDEFQTLRDRDNPFVRNAIAEGRSYG